VHLPGRAAREHTSSVTIVPLFGHQPLRNRLRDAARSGALPASLLLHGPRGVGKQRLALWLAQVLLCESAEAPCNECAQCRYSSVLAHPDIHWFFPRPRPKDSDADADSIRQDYAEAIAERVADNALYAPPSGVVGIYVATVRAIVQRAGISPALARRKVFILGDGESMSPQEGGEYAANAFLKLLEEPPADTTLIVTTSEPGALLPTIRSRVVAMRVAPLPDADMREFLQHETVESALSEAGLPHGTDARIALAGGAPGQLLAGEERSKAQAAGAEILAAARSGDVGARARVAMAQPVAGARGAFSGTLDALVGLLHGATRNALASADYQGAAAASRAVEYVEVAKLRAAGNVNPQLITMALLGELSEALR
jgi:DNA polymerase III subunit delta'